MRASGLWVAQFTYFRYSSGIIMWFGNIRPITYMDAD